MSYLLSQIFLCLLAAFILGLIVGWLFRHLTCIKYQQKLMLLRKEISNLKHKPPVPLITPIKQETVKEVIVEEALDDHIEEAFQEFMNDDQIDSQEIIEKEYKQSLEIKEDIENIEVITPPNNNKPLLLKTPKSGNADDLKRIKGVGKVLEATLNELGVFHFEQIASWSQDNIQWMDGFMKFPGRIKREKWVSQAKSFVSQLGK